MTQLNIIDTLLDDMNFVPRGSTKYETSDLDSAQSVYRIARHPGHTRIYIKINVNEFMSANGMVQ